MERDVDGQWPPTLLGMTWLCTSLLITVVTTLGTYVAEPPARIRIGIGPHSPHILTLQHGKREKNPRGEARQSRKDEKLVNVVKGKR